LDACLHLQKSQFRLLQAYLAARQTIKAGMGLPLKVLRGIRATFHPDTRDKIKRDVTEELETVDESLVGQIRHAYRTNHTAQLAPLNLAIVANADLLLERECGTAVRWEHLEMIPLFKGPGIPGQFAPPENALRLAKVTDYGEMVLENRHKLPTIVPLHLGYFQNAAQKIMRCVFPPSWNQKNPENLKMPVVFKKRRAVIFTEPMSVLLFCLNHYGFIILPQPLRDKALALRGVKDYAKLWDDISRFNHQLGLKQRGHLDELKRAYQPAFFVQQYDHGNRIGTRSRILGRFTYAVVDVLLCALTITKSCQRDFTLERRIIVDSSS